MKTTPRIQHIMHLALSSVLMATAAAAAPPLSHLNQPVLEHVLLKGNLAQSGVGGSVSWTYLGPGVYNNGLSVEAPVPAGRRLVITDVEWYMSNNKGAFRSTDSVWVEIHLTGGPGSYRAFQSRVLPGLGQDFVGASEQLTTGFTVAPTIRISAVPYAYGSEHGSEPYAALKLYILLRGYLIDPGPATPAPTQ